MSGFFSFRLQEMKKIFLVRHGVTTLNEQLRYCGITDAELSKQGLKQAQYVDLLLSRENISSIYTSPLKRCIQTSNLICKTHDIFAESLADLSEIDFGKWEGLTFEEIQKAFPEQLNKWFAHPDDFIFPQGESICDFRKRVLVSLDTILEEQGNSLIVAHGGSLRIIICHLCGWGPQSLHSFELEPASLTILENHENSVVVRVLNETCHLKNGGVN